MKEAGNVTVTILADNAAAPPYRAEHGYSALVETRGTDGSGSAILLDTGTRITSYNVCYTKLLRP